MLASKRTYNLVDVEIGLIIESFLKRNIERIIQTLACASLFEIAGAWEEVTVPMEGYSHDSVSRVEGLLHAISMVDVDVDVQNSIMILQKLKNCKDDIVYVAEAACLLLLCMVQSARPVDGDVCRLVIEFDRCINRCATADLGKLEHPREARAVILANLEVRPRTAHCDRHRWVHRGSQHLVCRVHLSG